MPSCLLSPCSPGLRNYSALWVAELYANLTKMFSPVSEHTCTLPGRTISDCSFSLNILSLDMFGTSFNFWRSKTKTLINTIRHQSISMNFKKRFPYFVRKSKIGLFSLSLFWIFFNIKRYKNDKITFLFWFYRPEKKQSVSRHHT